MVTFILFKALVPQFLRSVVLEESERVGHVLTNVLGVNPSIVPSVGGGNHSYIQLGEVFEQVVASLRDGRRMVDVVRYNNSEHIADIMVVCMSLEKAKLQLGVSNILQSSIIVLLERVDFELIMLGEHRVRSGRLDEMRTIFIAQGMTLELVPDLGHGQATRVNPTAANRDMDTFNNLISTWRFLNLN
jgi:hypothetical protein